MHTLWTKLVRFTRKPEYEYPEDGENNNIVFTYIHFGCLRKWDTYMPEQTDEELAIEWNGSGIINRYYVK